MAIMLFGYDVESLDSTVTRAFLDTAEKIHTRLEAPATLFLVGKTIELNIERLRALQNNPYFDFQSHTYSHKLLKTVCQNDGKGIRVFRGASLSEIEDEVVRNNELLHEVLGVSCCGLTGPYNYYRGLSDRPDILAILHKHGIRYLRTYGRNENDWQPVPLDVQPFWYEPQGFPDILECNINGWQDCIKREYYGWENRNDYVRDIKNDLDYVKQNDLVFSYCQHDWSSIRGDETMWITESIINYALDLGIRIVHYTDFYLEMLSRRRVESCDQGRSNADV
ncbi:MAG: polysaccharide deacetylase family protein [Alicyclobacillus sp.]|nr:polysaccharide deacetylase family protein [Alicyclobacillus sp.]